MLEFAKRPFTSRAYMFNNFTDLKRFFVNFFNVFTFLEKMCRNLYRISVQIDFCHSNQLVKERSYYQENRATARENRRKMLGTFILFKINKLIIHICDEN